MNNLNYGLVIRFIGNKDKFKIIRSNSILYIALKNLRTGTIEQQAYGIVQMRELNLRIAEIDGKRIRRK